MNSDHKNTKESLLARIEREHIGMHSHAYFMLRLVGLAVLALAVLITSVFICTFIFFTLRLNGHDALPGLGGSGILLFIRFFPWPLLALDILLVVLLHYLLRTFPVAYRTPWAYTVLALLVIVISTGVVVDRHTHFNDSLLHRADQGGLPPPFIEVYQGARRPPPPGSGAYRGTIATIASTSITINDPDIPDATLTVSLPPHPPGAPELKVGDVIFVIGREVQGVVQAVHIHVIDPDGVPPPARY